MDDERDSDVYTPEGQLTHSMHHFAIVLEPETLHTRVLIRSTIMTPTEFVRHVLAPEALCFIPDHINWLDEGEYEFLTTTTLRWRGPREKAPNDPPG